MSRIVLVLPDLVAGGAQRITLVLAREFIAQGHSVDLALIRLDGHFKSIVPAGVRLVDLGARTFGLGWPVAAIHATIKLSIWLRRDPPDAVLSNVTGTNLVTIAACKIAKSQARLVVREVSSLRNLRSRLLFFAMRRLYPRVDFVVALTDAMAIELEEVIAVPRCKLQTIANPVDFKMLADQADAPIHHPWLAQKAVPVIISVGRLVPAKDHDTLLRAFAKLSKKMEARLIILGDGPGRAAIEKRIHQLGLDQQVHLAGFDPNPWRWMSHADLYILSSRWEGHPNALLEAVALGLPTVATAYDQSVMQMAEKHGFTTVPPGDPESMAQALEGQLTAPKVPKCRQDLPDAAVIAKHYLDLLIVVAVR